ncbi:MAG TPA: PAS domain S-box protein, partial [Dermatophilaceae bacterium]
RMIAVRNAELIAAMVEYSDDAIMSGTLEGILTSWNPAAEKMYGYTSKEMIGRSGRILTPDDRTDEWSANLAMVKTGQHVEHVETERVRKDGTPVPVSLTLAPIHDEDGAIVGVSVVHRDVTEQRRALELAQRIEAIVEGSDDAIIGETPEGVITSWNPAATTMFGYSCEEIVGKSVDLLIPEGHAGAAKAVAAKVSAGQHVEHLETFNVRKDGMLLPVSLTVSPVRGVDGAIVGASVTCRDMSEQRRALEVAERMAAIVESSQDAIVGKTLDGIITSWNPAAERMYGYTGDEVVGKPARLLIPRGRPDETDAILAKISASQPVEHLEITRVRKDGTEFPVSLTVSPIRDADGEIIGASTIHRDMTAQMLALEATQRVAAIVEYSRDAIISRNLDGTITSWNPAAERMSGYTSEEVIGRTLSFMSPEDRSHEVNDVTARIEAGESVQEFETIRRRKDGTLYPVSLTLSPIRGANGAIIGISSIGRDMTEQQRAADYARSLIEAGPDPLMTISPEGRITDVNEATVQATGVPRHDLIGTSYLEYFTDRDRAREGYERVFAQGSVSSYPLTMRHRDGTLTSLLFTASPYCDLDGNVLGVLATGRDVTEQRRALEAAQMGAAIVESSDDAIVGRTLDGTITSWNPAAERMYGYTSEEIVGKCIDLLVPPDRAGETISILARLSAGKPVRNFETVRLRKDGTPFTVSLTLSPLRDDKDVVVGASVICRDITELRHAAQYARSLIEANLDPMETISPDGKITDVNEAAVKATGRPRHKLIGTDFSQYFTDPDKARQGYQRVFEQGSATAYPLTLRHRDGTLTDLLCNAAVYRDAAGNVLGVLAVAREKAS